MMADRQITMNGRVVGEQQKIMETETIVIGFCGNLELYKPFCDFITSSSFEIKDAKELKFEAIVVERKKNNVSLFCNSLLPTNEEAEYYCIGSGADIALGALHAGAGARLAMGIASRIDIYTGQGVSKTLV